MKPIELSLDAKMRAEIEALQRAVDQYSGSTGGSKSMLPFKPVADGKRIVGRLTHWLLDNEQKQTFHDQPWQLFYLHATACLCNLSLMDGIELTGNAGLAQRSHDWILQNWQALGIKDAERAAVVARICLDMQALTGVDSARIKSDSSTFAGMDIDTGLTAACLYLSKSLELKAPATFMEIVAFLPSSIDGSTKDYLDAFDVDDIGPHPHFAATIRVTIRCRDPELHRALKHHERLVSERLNRFNQRIRPRFLFSDLIYEIEPEGYRPVDLKFSVDTSAALQLFMGNRLYTDKRVFLRELIQNAVDACSIRKVTDENYSPEISIVFNDGVSVITIRDNGIGMDRQWLEKYFLSIGISFYQSDEIKRINQDPRIDIGFISQFGIGFLSSFLVAEKIVIKTRKDNSSGLIITITSLKDYFDVRPATQDVPIGTEVTLHLRPSRVNYCRSLEFVGYLKTNIRFLQIPVALADERGATTVIGNEPLTYAATSTAPSDFVAPVSFDDAEGYIYLGVKMTDSHIFALASASGGVSVFQDGIFVTQDDTLLPEGARQNVVGRINLKGRDKCELSMDRNRIFWTGEQKKQIRQRIRLALATVANRLMEAVAAQGATDRTRTSLINHLAIFFEFGEVNDAVHSRLCAPLQRVVEKRFRDFVRVHFAHTRSAAGVPDADGYGEQWQRRILASFTPKN